LRIACEGKAWEIVQNVEHENADANDTWPALEQQFQLEGIDDHAHLTNRFETREMENELENPRKWIRRSQGTNRRLGHMDQSHKHDDAEMTAETFLKLPKSHSKFTTSCELRRGEAGNVTPKDMTKDPQRHQEKKVWSKERGDGANKNRGKRAAFCASKEKSPAKTRPNANGFVNHSEAFKGSCDERGKQGHKASDCRVRRANCERGFESSTSDNEFKCTTSQNQAHKTLSLQRDWPNEKKTLSENKKTFS
jgi:hypothetical protein